MSSIRHTAKARGDLLDIWRTLAVDNPAAADRVFDRLQAKIWLLSEWPELGARRPAIAADARILVERPYLIFYRIIPHGVQVVRVLHGARNIEHALFVEGLE